jgi:protein gp37
MNITDIGWTDRTSNPAYAVDRRTGKRGWYCVKISDECDFCYSEDMNVGRFGNKLTYEHHNATRVEWRLNEKELDEWRRHRAHHKVFIEDMTDIFLAGIPPEMLARIWATIKDCPRLTFQLLTKRHGRIAHCLPPDWGEGYPNVWLGVSVGVQSSIRRIEVLRSIPAAVRFISFEPLLEDLGTVDLTGMHWAILGGESGGQQRPMELAWMISLYKQCKAAGIPVFIKQDAARLPGQQGRIPDWLWQVNEFPVDAGSHRGRPE